MQFVLKFLPEVPQRATRPNWQEIYEFMVPQGY